MADPNTPSWLQEDTNAPTVSVSGGSPAADVPFGSSTNGANAAATVDANKSSTAADEPALPGVILTMRLLNMGASIALIVCAILEMITIPKISGFVLAIYACIGGILICCLETQLKFLRVMIAVNFGFLFHSVWRFLFYCLLGSVAFTFDGLLGMIVGGVIVGVAIFNTYVLCRYPAYRRIREEIAREEDKRIEARISKEVKRQAVRQIVS
ncbi:hypothetical protein ACA910_012862 [Epithemia clementina (nom. ined.)]